MGYLNNASVSVDAILTTKGRQKVASGDPNGLGIAYFALGDDEINYDLWNPAHPLGSDYYGIIIENMPVLEASPIPEQNLKSKLITLPKSSTSIARLISDTTSIGSVASPGIKYETNAVGSSILTTAPVYSIEIMLSNLSLNTNNALGYTIFYDSRFFTAVAGAIPAAFVGTSSSPTLATSIGDISAMESNILSSIITTGKFNLSPKQLAPSILDAGTVTVQNIYVQSNDVGGRLTIPVYIQRA